MLYKFRSKASGDVIMLPAHGDAMLRLLGREPADRGIFEVAAMPALLGALQAAIERAEAAAPDDEAAVSATDVSSEVATEAARRVGLRQRVWPMIDMLRRCHAAGEPVVWGM